MQRKLLLLRSVLLQVLASANHVALYDFDQDDSRWVRLNSL